MSRIATRRSVVAVLMAAGLSAVAASPAFAGAGPGASLVPAVTAADSPCSRLFYKGTSTHPRELQLVCGTTIIKTSYGPDGKIKPVSSSGVDVVGGEQVGNEARVWIVDHDTNQGYALVRNLNAEKASQTHVYPTFG